MCLLLVATNKTGFTALPGGSRFDIDGAYYGMGDYGNWWTSTNFRVTDKTFNRAFSVGDAKGFDCVYNLGVKVRYAALYRNGIRVTIQYFFPSNDPSLFDKYAPDVDKVIRSIVIK